MVPAPHVVVLFGATGDLAHRMLFPALFRLWDSGLLPELKIIGSGRHDPGPIEEFRERIGAAVADEHGELDRERWAEFAQHVDFVTSDADDGEDLAAAVRAAESDLGEGTQRLHYLSVPPAAMQGMTGMLHATGLTERARLVLEKPFGHDLDSAEQLHAALAEVVDEQQVFRIDHFLGKEAVQNILALRFANAVLDPVWHGAHVESVQIDVPETLGLEGRASFMESTGTFRDMITTHLLQVLSIVAMEPPVHLDPDGLHAEKQKVFDAMRPLDHGRVVFGQFEGYRDADGVADDSDVETFVACEAFVDTPRWQGVPFFLRTGKCLGESAQVVTLRFRRPPMTQFPGDTPPADELVLDLTGSPTAHLDLRTKRPGPGFDLTTTPMRLDVAAAAPDAPVLAAYERLLLDVTHGDHTLFATTAQVERLWELCDPVLADRPTAQPYPQGSFGPREALELPGPRGWRVAG